MIRRINQIVFSLALLVASGGGLFLFHEHNSVENKMQRKMDAQQADFHQQMESQKVESQKEIDAQTRRAEEMRKRAEQLKVVVKNLETEQRVAEIVVTNQSESAGVLRSTLLLVEYARDGRAMPGKEFVIEGRRAHIDAMVVKFDGHFVEENDSLRGHSVALFTSLYDQTHSPANAYQIDQPGHVPEVYRGADPHVSEFEQDLWNNFWKLADDPAYRKSMGVHVAQGQGVWRDFDPGFLYTLTVESNGGLMITSDPLKGIYQQALKSQNLATQPTTAPTLSDH